MDDLLEDYFDDENDNSGSEWQSGSKTDTSDVTFVSDYTVAVISLPTSDILVQIRYPVLYQKWKSALKGEGGIGRFQKNMRGNRSFHGKIYNTIQHNTIQYNTILMFIHGDHLAHEMVLLSLKQNLRMKEDNISRRHLKARSQEI